VRRRFVDSSFYYAVAAEEDPNHRVALDVASEATVVLCTSRYVLAETMSLLTKRASKSAALRIAQAFILSSEACLLDVTNEDFDAAWDLFAEYPDWDFDLVDAISFALMRREEIEAALTFDHHFAHMGFEALPG
jgi:predicted nucleic acid-binding protein